MPRTINTNLATADHIMKAFSQIAPFLQSQLNKKLICDLISQLIFKLFQQIQDYFKTILIVYNMCNYY